MQVAFGLLCSAGVASMTEILDPCGPWSMDLVETMMPVALEIEVNRERAQFRATAAGASALFSKDAALAYDSKLAAALKEIRDGQTSPDKTREQKLDQAADDIMDFFFKSPHMKREDAPKPPTKGARRGR